MFLHTILFFLQYKKIKCIYYIFNLSIFAKKIELINQLILIFNISLVLIFNNKNTLNIYFFIITQNVIYNKSYLYVIEYNITENKISFF